MIISRTPYRISFFGGGTDYPDWYLQNGGHVISTTIDKYVYISCRYLPPFFDHKLRFVYSRIEAVNNSSELIHPSAREILRHLGIKNGLEIHYDGDLPGRSGMGSSSAFSAGLLNTLHHYKGRTIPKENLARETIHIEQKILKEAVGSQDQISAAYGGLNHIRFLTNSTIEVSPLEIECSVRKNLNDSLMLFFTGIVRSASDVASSILSSLDKNNSELKQIGNLVEQGIDILKGERNIDDFGRLLHQVWVLKRRLSGAVSNSKIDHIYDRALSAGALGGKIMGAGGGGFLLLYVKQGRQEDVRRSLSEFHNVPFRFSDSGSEIIFSCPDQEYPLEEKRREEYAKNMTIENSRIQ